jgi:outer membrane protein assembly factor BamB
MKRVRLAFLMLPAAVMIGCGGGGKVSSGAAGGSPFQLEWSFSTTGPIYYSSPAIAPDGTIYFGNGGLNVGVGALIALDPNGHLKWQHPFTKAIFTPAVGPDGTVYVQDLSSSLYAINPDGTLKWSFLLNAPSTIGQAAPAIDSDGTLFIGGDALYAVNPDGTRKWRYPGSASILPIRSSPAIATDGTIILGGNPNGITPVVWAINPDGSLKWQASLTDSAASAAGLAVFTFSSPGIGSDGTIYIGAEPQTGGSRAFVFAINPDGSQKWEYIVTGFRPIRSSPAIGPDGTIYVATTANAPSTAAMLALLPGGTLKWSYQVQNVHSSPDDVWCSPAVGSNGAIYFGAATGFVYALNAENGTLDWDFNTNSMINWSSPPIGAGGNIYIGAANGSLYALKSATTLASTAWPKFRHDNQNTGRLKP